jgi:predicted phosphate transport protein (TIGR00153 family)
MAIAMFGKVKALEGRIDEMLNTLSQAGMLFEQLVKRYLAHGADKEFEEQCQKLKDLEQSGNGLSREIARSLYTEMLIPDSRGDVLSLLQYLDYLLDQYEHIATAISVEKPALDAITEQQRAIFTELLENSVKCVEASVVTARAFFKNLRTVEDNAHKIGFYETEADHIASRLKREIFDSDMGLDRKMQARYFVDKIDELADEAEELGEEISIYTIKRSL